MLEIKELKADTVRTLISQESAMIFGGQEAFKPGDNTVCGGATIDYEGDGGQTQHAYNDHIEATSILWFFPDREIIVDSGRCS